MGEALDHLHSLNIVHRDVKPENLLLTTKGDDAVLKLCDFGLASEVPEGGLERACGTPTYVAPEVIKENTTYGTAIDWWSTGVIMYLLLCGFPPFYDENQKRLFKKIKNGFIFFPSPYWDNVSRDARNLVLGLLKVQPHQRYSSRQLLNHTWIKRDANKENMEDSNRRRLKRFNIRTKMRRATHTVLALTKLIALLVDPETSVEELIKSRNERCLSGLEIVETGGVSPRHNVGLSINTETEDEPAELFSPTTAGFGRSLSFSQINKTGIEHDIDGPLVQNTIISSQDTEEFHNDEERLAQDSPSSMGLESPPATPKT